MAQPTDDPGAELPGDFDRALLREGMAGLYMSPIDRRVLDAMERALQRHHPSTTDPDDSPRIPLVLHQIWLGDEPLPARFRRYRERWLELHPGWEHRLWTDAEVAELDFDSRDLFEQADNHGMRSDILRAEIVGRFGGVYADVDYECLRPLDPLNHLYDFYGVLRAGVGARVTLPTIFPTPLVVCTSLFGAVPGHPVLADYLDKVRRLWPRRDEIRLGWWRVETWLAGGRARDLLKAKRTAKVTYLPFGTAVKRHFAVRRRGERFVVLPPSWFNPIDTWWGPRRFLAPTYWRGIWRHASSGGRGMPPHYTTVPPHAFAVHHSSASWI